MPCCVFCGEPKVFREHAWPQWVKCGLPNPPKRVVHTRRGATCNSGWMARLEDDARPLLAPADPRGPESRPLTVRHDANDPGDDTWGITKKTTPRVNTAREEVILADPLAVLARPVVPLLRFARRSASQPD
jgi:hypothetical protein